MRIKNRLSPYPILDNYGDDYVESYFNATYDVSTQFAEIYGKISFELCNDEIKKLIDSQNASYLVHIECPATCFREIYCTEESEIDFRLSAANLSKVIEIRTFIVLTKNLKGFTSQKFHPDYAGQKFDLEAHQIIAIGTAKNFDIGRDDRDLESLPSVFRITKLKDRKKGSLSVNTDNDNYIMVGLTEEVYEEYARLGKSTFKASSFSLVLLPTLVIVLQRMHMNKDDSDMNSRHWFQVINNILVVNGYALDDISIENDKLLTVCQSIFADPIARGFKELDACSERM